MAKKRYRVIVSRINEPADAEPTASFLADRIEITSDGSLRLSWEGGGYSYSSGLWNGVEVKVLRRN